MSLLTEVGPTQREVGTVSRRPMRVLQVIGNVDVGGAEKRMLDVARFVDHSRFELHFCLLSKHIGRLGNDFRSTGANLHTMPLGARFPLRFLDLLKRFQFDVVHAHMHFSAGLVMRLAAYAGTKVRVSHFRSCHDGKRNSIRRRLQKGILKNWIDKCATHVVACGNSVMYSNWGQQNTLDSRFVVVQNGLDVDPFCVPRDRAGVASEFDFSVDSPLFIHVGNIRRPKNHLKLFSVFRQILKHQPTSNLILVGQGNGQLQEYLRQYAEQHRIAQRIHFAGLRSDVPRLLRAADAMIFPSLWEGLPGAVLEACAADVPVLGSAIPEIEEIRDHFPRIRCLPLSMDDDIWAQEAIAMTRTERNRTCNQQAITEFQKSPYAIQSCVNSLSRIWSGEIDRQWAEGERAA